MRGWAVRGEGEGGWVERQTRAATRRQACLQGRLVSPPWQASRPPALLQPCRQSCEPPPMHGCVAHRGSVCASALFSRPSVASSLPYRFSIFRKATHTLNFSPSSLLGRVGAHVNKRAAAMGARVAAAAGAAASSSSGSQPMPHQQHQRRRTAALEGAGRQEQVSSCTLSTRTGSVWLPARAPPGCGPCPSRPG